jgi:hypothetical protein
MIQIKKLSFKSIQTLFIEKVNYKNDTEYNLYRKFFHAIKKTNKYQ